MTKNVPDGLFITFEGIEGSGKTTQSNTLTSMLSEAGYKVRQAIEPGGTPTGELIRQWVKSDTNITPLSELFLFSAARAALVETVIVPAMAVGTIVVCDRYQYSTTAYQGHGRGLDMDTIACLNWTSTGGLLPQLVILLDMPPGHTSTRKASVELDRIERESESFHLRVREGYLEQARLDPERWLVIDATRSVNEIAHAVWTRVGALLPDG